MPDSLSTNEEGPSSKPPWPLFWAVLGALVLMLAAYAAQLSAWRLFFLELLVALAAMAVGLLVGFVFGIPRAPSEPDGAKTGAAAEAKESGYAPNTNLEQISDWLTKIIVGVGLVEAGNIRDALAFLGDSAKGALAPEVPGASFVTQVVIIVSAVMTFLAGFLWTRLYYGEIQQYFDAKTRARYRRLQTSQPQTPAAPIKATVSVASVAESPRVSMDPDEVRKKIEKFRKAPVRFNSDPTGDLFGNCPSKVAGRELIGEVNESLTSALILTVSLRRTEGERPLEGNVTFLLHPTLPDSVQTVPAKDGSAEVKFYSEGWFHVAAIADNYETVLALDLRKVPGVPKWYTEA